MEKEEYVFNLKLLSLIDNLLINSDIVNTIIHGPPGSGKKCIANYLIDHYFKTDKQVYNLKKINYGSQDPELYIMKSPHHYEFDSNDNNFNDKKITGDFIREIAKTINISTNTYKIIVIKNSENLSHGAQIVITKLLELYSTTCRIIFICHNLSKMADQLKSRCLTLRVESPTDENIKLVIDNIINKEQIDISESNLFKLIENSKNNINISIHSLQRYYLSDKLTDNYIEKFINDFSEQIFDYNLEDNTLRENLYLLLLYDININVFLKKIIDKIHAIDLSFDKRYKIINAISYYSYVCIKGYRQIYHYETILYYIINILKNIDTKLLIEHI